MSNHASGYVRVDPLTGRMEQISRNQPAHNARFDAQSSVQNHVSSNLDESPADTCTAKAFIAAAVFLGLAFITASIVIPLYLVPVLAVTTTESLRTIAITTTTSTTTASTTSVTTSTAVSLYIPFNYYIVCGATCVNVTTVTPATLIASWEFENNLIDSVGIYHGAMASGTSYVSGYIDQAVSMNTTRYVMINSPFMNLTNRAFTVEAWIYLTSLNLTYDTGIFAQCHNFTTRCCLHYVIRSGKLYMGFFGDDTAGTINVPLNVWFHAAFVYNMAAATKITYLDGVFDAYGTAGGAYQGVSGATFIGYTNHTATANPLSGYIDQVTVSNRAKTAFEILNDATLVSRFRFDMDTLDVGPNTLTSVRTVQVNSGISFVTGVVNQAVMLSLPNSFVQVCGYHSLARPNHAFSFALWINPSAPLGTVLHLSSEQSGSGAWCLPMLGFSTNGSLVAQSWSGSSVSRIFGPQLPTNNWTHIAETWSSANGLRLYVNGDLYGSTTLTTFSASNTASMCISLGTSGFGTNCITSGINTGSYMGAIDEFYAYNREITGQEVCPLAHP